MQRNIIQTISRWAIVAIGFIATVVAAIIIYLQIDDHYHSGFLLGEPAARTAMAVPWNRSGPPPKVAAPQRTPWEFRQLRLDEQATPALCLVISNLSARLPACVDVYDKDEHA